MKKNIVVLTCSIALVAILILVWLWICSNLHKEELFIHSYLNNSSTYESYGYIIYDDGTIEEYDSVNKNRDLKKLKITAEELDKLKDLSTRVKDEFVIDTSMILYDSGMTTNQIYNSQTQEWILLSMWGDTIGSNSSKEAQAITLFINELYQKYLNP